MPTIQYPAPPTGAERDALIARMASVIQMEPPTKPQPWFHRPYIPMLRRKHYSFADLRGDVLSGVIAAVVAIPQGLAYALLASLPPVVGLYTSSLPPMIYAGLGTSNVCSIGPNALVAMFLPQLVYHWEFASDPSAVAARSSLAAIIVGVVNLLIGMVRLGGLVRFISGPVLTGFTNAAAMVIFISQLPIILGFAMPQFPYVYQQLTFLLGAMFEQTRPISLAVGLATVLFLYLCRFLSKRFHYSTFCQALGTGSCLIAAVLATVASRSLILSGHDIQILGHVPSGMPSFAVPKRGYSGDLSELGSVITSCVPVAFLAFMSLWSVAKKYAEKLGHADLDPNQEAFALGMTNIFGGFFSCFPSAASFSRSALNETSGARSPLSNLFVGLMVAVCLVALTPLLYYLPMPCLGGIILVALLGMVDLAPFWLAYRIAKPDFIVMVSAFLFTATISIEVGLVTGIMVSIAALLQELSEVQTSEMVPVAMPGPDSMHKQDLVKVIRLTMNIFFGSMEGLKETFTQVLEQGGSRLRAVVVDAAGVSHADLSGILGLDEMYKHAEDRGIKFVIIHAHGAFRDRLKAAGLFHKLGQHKYQHMPTSEVVRCLIIDLANDPRNGDGHGGSSGSFGAIPEDFDEEAAGLVSGATSLNGNGTKYGST